MAALIDACLFCLFEKPKLRNEDAKSQQIGRLDQV
jgi:hypothetical protein